MLAVPLSAQVSPGGLVVRGGGTGTRRVVFGKVDLGQVSNKLLAEIHAEVEVRGAWRMARRGEKGTGKGSEPGRGCG